MDEVESDAFLNRGQNAVLLELGKNDISDEVQVSLELPFAEMIDSKLSEIDSKLGNLSIDLDKFTSNADATDLIVAASSGILASVLDILFVKEFNFDKSSEWADDKIENFVIKVAKKKGYKGNDKNGAIRHLEQFGTPSDSVTGKFGGGKQHHLRDFAHHASPIGLAFSIISQFTGKAYGTPENSGMFQAVDITDKTFIGDTIPKKLIFGFVYWIFHMASDMAGSSSTLGKGTGIPGPLLSTVKMLSSLPIFKDEEGVNQLSVKVSKLFNGTLLADRDENGHIARGTDGKPLTRQMDLRGELAFLHEIAKLAIPVMINEVIVRGFYFVSRLIREIENNGGIKGINWQNTIPASNRTIVRMMTCASGVMSLIDTADAVVEGAIHSKGKGVEFGKQVLFRLNFVGLGRFAIAFGTDAVMGAKKSKQTREQMLLKNEALYLMNAKVYHGQALIWSASRDACESINGLLYALQLATQQVTSDMGVAKQLTDEIAATDLDAIEDKNPGLLKSILYDID